MTHDDLEIKLMKLSQWAERVKSNTDQQIEAMSREIDRLVRERSQVTLNASLELARIDGKIEQLQELQKELEPQIPADGTTDDTDEKEEEPIEKLE